jgi:Ca-activated chloride channel family protein
MFLTSVSVYSITPPGGFPKPAGAALAQTESKPEVKDAPAQTELGRFTAGGTIMVEGRVGHTKLARSSNGETFVMLEVRGGDGLAAKTAAPVNLALVIDRSGSMKGTRIKNAIAAASAAVDRLNEGDVVSVITFDTQTQLVVPPTAISPGTRDRINASIRGISLGGDTCISCGIEEAMSQLAQTSGRVNRVILLSDGDANHGVRDVPGFRSMAQRALGRGVSVTTIGVDVDYNEKIMAAIAQDSNGRHYFVQNDAALARVFEEEAQSLTRTVASNVEVAIDLAPGVELDRVFDRTFRRAGNQVIVPLGAFSGSDVKTVLVKVRVPRDKEGVAPVANVELNYRDLVTGNDGRCGGKLAMEIVPSAGEATDLDPVVSGRVQRAETAATLKDANNLFEQGKVEEARRKLAAREAALRSEAERARRAAPSPKAKDVSRDFDGQLAAVGEANQGFNAPQFATPPPGGAAPAAPAAPPQASREGKSAVKQNQQRAFEMGF